MNTNLVAIKIKKGDWHPISKTTTTTTTTKTRTTTEIKFQLEETTSKVRTKYLWNSFDGYLRKFLRNYSDKNAMTIYYVSFVSLQHFHQLIQNPQLENLNYHFILRSGYYKYLNNMQGHSLYKIMIYEYFPLQLHLLLNLKSRKFFFKYIFIFMYYDDYGDIYMNIIYKWLCHSTMMDFNYV